MRKNIALVLALVMILSLIPMTAFANQSATYTNLTGVQSVSKQVYGPGANRVNVNVEIKVPAFALNGAADLRVEIPRGMYVDSFNLAGHTSRGGVTVALDSTAGVTGGLASSRTIRYAGGTNAEELKTVLQLNGVVIADNFSGDEVKLGMSSSTQVFGDAELLVLRVTVGDMVASISDVNFITDAGGTIGILRATESNAGAFAEDDTVEFKLPRGFYWRAATITPSDRWGGGNTLPVVDWGDRVNGRPQTLIVESQGGSSVRASWEIIGAEIVVDPTMAAYGEVEVSVSGASPSTLVVAQYGDFLAEVTGVTKPHRLAGKVGQRLGDFEIKELIGGTLLQERTITMTLPTGVKWDVRDDGTFDTANGRLSVRRADSMNFRGYDQLSWEVVDIAGRTLRARIGAGQVTDSQNPATVVFEAPRVAISPDFRGEEIVVTFGGSAGVGGEVALATVTKPVIGEVVEMTNVRLGVQNQAIGDIVITEAKSGALAREGVIELTPVWNGVRFASTPVVEAEGDIMVEDVWTSPNGDTLSIQVSADSDKEASTLTLSNVVLSLDRVLPEGELLLEIKGTAVVAPPIYEDFSFTDLTSNRPDGSFAAYFRNADVSSAFAVAEVVTPAPGDVVDGAKAEVKFTVGSTSFTVDGVMGMMDVAPFISNDRLMVPVRYLEDVFGVQPVWNGAARTVTVLYEGKVFEMAIGSNVLRVNGAPYMELDATVEIVNERTFVPASRFARAMGIDYSWDATTQTATFK